MKKELQFLTQTIDSMISSLLMKKLELQNASKNCPDEADGETGGKKRRRRKNKKTTISRAQKNEENPEPKKPSRPPMRRIAPKS